MPYVGKHWFSTDGALGVLISSKAIYGWDVRLTVETHRRRTEDFMKGFVLPQVL